MKGAQLEPEKLALAKIQLKLKFLLNCSRNFKNTEEHLDYIF